MEIYNDNELNLSRFSAGKNEIKYLMIFIKD